MRKIYLTWCELCQEAGKIKNTTPTFKIDFSKYLPTDVEKMKKSVRFADNLSTTLPLQQRASVSVKETEESSFEHDKDYWLEKYRENEEYLRKLAEMRLLERNYIDSQKRNKFY